MQVLIIFDWFGEQSPSLYLIPDAPDWLMGVHETFINADSEHDDTLRVVDAISDADYTNPNDPICGAWRQYKIELTDLLTCTDCRIVYTGFVP